MAPFHDTISALMSPATDAQIPEKIYMESDDARFRRRVEFFRNLCPTEICGTPYFHVAGTNGKGSVCELLRSCLHASGRTVGIFTSPHVHTIRERIRVGATLISKEAMTRHVGSLQSCFKSNCWLSFFDRLLAVALLHFAEVGIDTLILEVGIGGKYDSTNFMLQPATVSIITSISYDHQALLGNSLADIAHHKAGIVKSGTTVLYPASLPAAAIAVVSEKAKLCQAKVVVVKASDEDEGGGSASPGLNWVVPDNLRLARAALAQAGVSVDGTALTFWPCRFEEFEVGDESAKVVLDGAHNADSMKMLMRRIGSRYCHRGVYVVFGAAADKSLSSILDEVLCSATNVVLVRAPHPRAVNTSELLHIVERSPSTYVDRITYEENMSVEDGLQLAIRQCNDGGIIVVCGSLYVAARARKWLAQCEPRLFEELDWVHESDDEWHGT